MKRFIQFFSFIAIALAITAVSANAQTGTRVEAQIPFDFSIGDTKFSSGTYELRLIKNDSGSARVLFNDKDGKTVHSALVLRSGDAPSETARLVFDVAGETRSLATMVTRDAGYSLPKSKRPRSVSVRASIPLRAAPERN